MSATVYVETSVVSYLTSLPSRDLVTAAHQQITREWWAKRDRFELFVSQFVLDELAGGDSEAAERRLREMVGIGRLAVVKAAHDLARELIAGRAIPPNATIDALHVATAAVHGIDYLVTWNCKHIANAVLRQRIESVCRQQGFAPPTICTPEELLEE
ncbi:MAG: type II toxin-antitoxin system VapC family toxin [Planctomycetota bacterium]